jgi:hypothetical protein
MSFRELNFYYQYANCISESNIFYKKSLITRNFRPEEASNLQLLSISLPDSNNSFDFMLSKELLNIINSYSAQFSQSEFDSLDFDFIQFILFVLMIIVEVLELNYEELLNSYEQNLIISQVKFILQGIPLLFEPNDDNKQFKLLNEANNIDKESVLNKLNKYESIASNENYQVILKKVLGM